MTDYVIRQASPDEFATAIDWAAAEGWNPGLDDLAAFHAADPAGFLMGFEGEEAISSLSVVRYGPTFGFLGFYIVRPDRRGTGKGWALWQAGMAHLGDRTIGLDGVVEQQANYAKSGFKLAGRNIRHAGPPRGVGATPLSDAITIRPPGEADRPALVRYDATHFPCERAGFIGDWVLPGGGGTQRRSLLAAGPEGIQGMGTIRACRDGFKIGPLFADDPDIAGALFDALIADLPADAQVALDTPEDNAQATGLARRAGLAPVFETARMYRGADPGLPIQRIFGVTTFELG